MYNWETLGCGIDVTGLTSRFDAPNDDNINNFPLRSQRGRTVHVDTTVDLQTQEACGEVTQLQGGRQGANK